MYGANATPGRRGQASVFADPGDWGRLGQFMVGFDTAPRVPSGEGAERYQVTSVLLTLIASGEPSFVYDDSYDPVSAFPSPDADPGRPIELHGVGYRSGYAGADFAQAATPLGGDEGRNAYPLSWDETGAPRDVSSNVADGFESAPWSVGEVVGVNPGDAVTGERDVRFELDLSDPRVAEHVAQSLDQGEIYFMISSLQPATEQGGTFVNFFTADSQEHVFFGGYAPRLEIEYEIGDPEPVDLPPLLITSVELVGGRLELQWEVHPGQTYAVEASSDGEAWQVIWTAASDSAGTGRYTIPGEEERPLFRVTRNPT
jgi:hypothetical protein